MSSRFHNKFHRFNHHSNKTTNIPDAGWDPIASAEAPFLGEFVLSGFLSAYSPNSDFSIYTDRLRVDDYIQSENVYVTHTLTADVMDINYLDVHFFETSGYAIVGSDFTPTVPAQTPPANVLLLSGVGLSTTSWASFGGNVTIANTLNTAGISIINCLSTDCIQPATNGALINIGSAYSPQFTITSLSAQDLTITGCISTDCIQSNTGTLINIGSAYSPYMEINVLSSDNITTNVINATSINVDNINQLNNSYININTNVNITDSYALSVLDVYATNVFGTNYFGITTDNLQINVSQGWRPPVITYVTPQFETWKYALDNNTNYPTLTTDMFVFVTVSANDYRCYGEFEAIVGNHKVAGTKIGNIGLLPNANVEHALSAGLWLDEEKSFSFIAASGSDWQLNTLSGYYDANNPDANLVVSIAVYQQDLRQLSFAGDTFRLNNLSLNGCVSTDCINPYTTLGTINVNTDLNLSNKIISNVGVGGYSSNQWNSVYTQVNANSAGWETTESSLNSLSAKWNSNYASVNTLSAGWVSTRTTVNANSADWLAGSDVSVISGNWQSTYTNVNTNSGSWGVAVSANFSSTSTIDSVATANYRGAFYELILQDDSLNARASQVMAVWNANGIQFTDTATSDIGNTAGITLSAGIVGSDAILQGIVTSGNWLVKGHKKLVTI